MDVMGKSEGELNWQIGKRMQRYSAGKDSKGGDERGPSYFPLTSYRLVKTLGLRRRVVDAIGFKRSILN